MGQNISMIITKEIDAKISDKIPHIIENDLLIIVLKNNEFARFIKRVLRACATDLDYYIEDFEFITLIHFSPTMKAIGEVYPLTASGLLL